MLTPADLHKEGALSGQEAVQGLLSRFGDLSQRLSHMAVTIENLRDRMENLGHLTGRVTASMMLMVGAPRVLRGGMFYGLAAGGLGGGVRGGFLQSEPDTQITARVALANRV